MTRWRNMGHLMGRNHGVLMGLNHSNHEKITGKYGLKNGTQTVFFWWISIIFSLSNSLTFQANLWDSKLEGDEQPDNLGLVTFLIGLPESWGFVLQMFDYFLPSWRGSWVWCNHWRPNRVSFPLESKIRQAIKPYQTIKPQVARCCNSYTLFTLPIYIIYICYIWYIYYTFIYIYCILYIGV